MTHLRWGILGTGNIAHQFAEGVAHAHRSRVLAVGSRTQRNADDFAGKFSIPHSHGAYADLVRCDAIDAVYISLPNSLHHRWTIEALRAGKHVLCEKPFAACAAEAEQMFDVARREDRLLVEAFMYRSHPLTRQVLKQVRTGAIGELKLIRTSFCYSTRRVEENTRFSANLAGGALMDVGCYCLSLARLLADAEPEQAFAAAHLHETGIDDYAAGTLQFPSGVLAEFVCGLTVQSNNSALVCGDEGYIEIPVPWKPPVNRARYLLASMAPPRQEQLLTGRRASRRTVEVDAHVPLYALEADDFAAAVLDGKPPAVSEPDTLGNMRLLDQLRQQIGVPVATLT